MSSETPDMFREVIFPSAGLLAVPALALLLVACGSSTPSSSGTGGQSGAGSTLGAGSNSPASSEIALPDPCSLLSASDITNVLGASKPSQSGVNASGPPGERSCSWADLSNPTGSINVLLGNTDPASGVNAVDILMGSSGPAGTSVNVSSDGKLFTDRAIIAGGGGIGMSVWFHKNGISCVVSQTGSSVDQQKLVTAATSAAAALH